MRIVALVILASSSCAASVHGVAAYSIDSTGKTSVELHVQALSGAVKGSPEEPKAIWLLLGLEASAGIELGSYRPRGSFTLYPVGASTHTEDRGHTGLFGMRARWGRPSTLGVVLAYAYDHVVDAALLEGPCSDEARDRFHSARGIATLDVGWNLEAKPRRAVLTFEAGAGYAWTGYDFTHPFTECPEPVSPAP